MSKRSRLQITIGDVLLARVLANGDLEEVPLMGEPRVEALRAAFHGEPIPGGLVLMTQSLVRLKWEDVRWDTATDVVTGMPSLQAATAQGASNS